jgi:hypothetical protein
MAKVKILVIDDEAVLSNAEGCLYFPRFSQFLR